MAPNSLFNREYEHVQNFAATQLHFPRFSALVQLVYFVNVHTVRLTHA